MTRCADVEKLVTSYIDGDIDEHRARAVRGHARECEQCARLLEDENAVAGWLRDLDSVAEPPTQLWGDIQRRLATEEREDARRSKLGLWWSNVRQHAVPALSVAAIVVMGAGILTNPSILRRDGDAVGPESELATAAVAGTAEVVEGAADTSADAVTFADERRRQLENADRHFLEAVAELRADVGDAAAGGELAAELERLDGELTAARARVIGDDALAARDEMQRLYLEQIALLQDAAIDGDWM